MIARDLSLSLSFSLPPFTSRVRVRSLYISLSLLEIQFCDFVVLIYYCESEHDTHKHLDLGTGGWTHNKLAQTIQGKNVLELVVLDPPHPSSGM